MINFQCQWPAGSKLESSLISFGEKRQRENILTLSLLQIFRKTKN